jgi:hypothetical protein
MVLVFLAGVKASVAVCGRGVLEGGTAVLVGTRVSVGGEMEWVGCTAVEDGRTTGGGLAEGRRAIALLQLEIATDKHNKVKEAKITFSFLPITNHSPGIWTSTIFSSTGAWQPFEVHAI